MAFLTERLGVKRVWELRKVPDKMLNDAMAKHGCTFVIRLYIEMLRAEE